MSDAQLIVQSVILGIAATTAMTIFMYLASVLTHKQLRVVHILGTMITNTTTPGKNVSNSLFALVTGTLLHYLIGIGFAYVFLRLMLYTSDRSIVEDVTIYGFVIGTIAVIVWHLFIRLHRHPPSIPVRQYLLFIFLGHLIFVLTLELSWLLIQNMPV